MNPLLSAAILSAGFLLAQTAPPAAGAEAPTAPAAEEKETPVDLDADEPPLSSYDKQLRRETPTDPVEDGERSLLAQLARTIIALIIVVGLIYLFARFGLQRILGFRAKATGSGMKIVERLPIDNRQSLLVVEVGNGQSFLLGAGDKGVQLISELQGGPPSPEESKAKFSEAMDRTAKPAMLPAKEETDG